MLKKKLNPVVTHVDLTSDALISPVSTHTLANCKNFPPLSYALAGGQDSHASLAHGSSEKDQNLKREEKIPHIITEINITSQNILRFRHEDKNVFNSFLRKPQRCVISCFCHDTDGICALLMYYAASSGSSVLTFQGNTSVPSSRVKELLGLLDP
jgi:hypothetical protein